MNNDTTILVSAANSTMLYIEWGIIISILIIQVIIFIYTIKKILFFKNLIPEVSDFKISKILIPKQHLEFLEPFQILRDIYKYPSLDENSDEVHTEFKRFHVLGIIPQVCWIKAKQTVQAFIEHRVSIENDDLKTNYISLCDMGEDPENALKKAKASVRFGKSKQLDFTEVPLIILKKSSNTRFLDILKTLNTYLLRNKGSISDFNIMKDVIDRNCDSIDEEINTTIPIPLYLGLMGTMIGIVIGLNSLPSIGSASFLNGNGIDILIHGVYIAMYASLAGLFITIANSFWYKGSKSDVENNKNELFSFLQAELLPVLSKDTLSVVHTLRDNLEVFNNNFKSNISGFDSAISDIQGIFSGQTEMLKELKEIDVAQIAKINVTVLKELRQSAQEFEKFNMYINQLNSFVENIYGLNTRFNELLARTGNFEDIAVNIKNQTDKSVILQEFLRSHFSVLELSGTNVQQMATNFDKVLSESLDQLKLHTHDQIENIKKTTVDQNTEFKRFLEETEKNYYRLINEKKGNFEYLKNLEAIKNNSESLVHSVSQQQTNIELKQIKTLLENQPQIKQNKLSRKEIFWQKVKYYSTISFFVLGSFILLGFAIEYIILKIIPLIQKLF